MALSAAAARTPRINVDAIEGDEEEEEEEEDVDFNPFMREEVSSEASSGLSSENEAPGDTAEVSLENSVVPASEQPSVDVSRNPNSLEPKDHELTKSSLEGTNPQKRVLELDEEDLICRRTRARHSLEDYTLEELETFLQESDNEDNLHNADDESEYRRFLSAVLNGDSEVGEGDGNFDDDENDVDFAIEIEEALESDGDEYFEDGGYDELGADGRKPVTRQRKRVKGSNVNKKHNSVHFKTPVRPILPYVRKEQITCSPPQGWQLTSSQSVSNCAVSESGGNVVNAFTDDQISQLYCLMHEHAQLLIQVYSVCVLDPSKQKIAAEVRKMIGQMLDKREQALAQSRAPYRGTCFLRRNLHSSVHSNSLEIASSAFWTPLTDKPVRSILDVAPLALAKSFMTDVSAIVLKQKQSYLEDSGDKRHLEKIPLFPLPTLASSDKSAKPRGSAAKSQAAQPHSSGHQQQKKSLATTIVENNKTGLVALVPKDIAVLAQRFYPIFNPTLFPPTPPSPSVAGRVLFTDAEDGLLAMGIMEYNNEWTKIQQRFLPCKSQHQIFVRQKNRSSSKAPENPIKNVRRMKISPLTADELAHICEGLKLFKEDWNLVWKYCVPHRDPSLLPRQWRIASGTQKSYKASEAFKVKRRVYEANRRRLKASVTDSVLPEKEVGDEENMAVDMDDEGEAYVHEAFLADGEPRSFKTMSSDIPPSSMNMSCVQLKNAMPNMCTDFSEKCAAVTSELRESPQPSGAMHGVVTSSEPHLRDTNPSEPHSRDTNPSEPHLRDANPSNNTSYVRYTSFRAASEQLSPKSNSQALALHLGSWSSHMPERRGSRVVKLAPGLPPVNLPRSVRVISQPGSRICIKRSYVSKADDSAMKNYPHGLPQTSRKRTASTKSTNNENMFQANDPQSNSRHDERLVADQCTVEENASESDFHMHPLLFQDAEGQASSYYSASCTASGTYNFFPELSLQPNSNLHGHQSSVRTHIGRTEGQKEAPLNLITLDFHPLLQRADNGSGNYAFISSIGCPSGDSEALQGNCDKFGKPSDHGFRENTAGHAELPICTGSPSHREKENIDLEISLCSAPEKEKSAGVLDSRPSVEESIHPLQHIVVQEGLHGDNRYINHKYRCPQGSFATNSSIMLNGPQSKNFLSIEVVPQSNAAEVSHDVSVPEIIMEQEELSDSEEEIQDVEFEREEMDDSEGEGFNSEQPSEIQTKELLNSACKGSRVRHIQDLNQMPQEPTEGKTSMSLTGGMHQESRRAKTSRLKPNNEGAKRGRSCRSSVNASGSRTRKPRKLSGVK